MSHGEYTPENSSLVQPFLSCSACIGGIGLEPFPEELKVVFRASYPVKSSPLPHH